MATAQAGVARPYRRWIGIAAVAVILALPLVTPVDGGRVSLDHTFQLVHPIFPHVHEHAHEHDAESDGRAWGAATATPMLAVTSAGPSGAGLGAANQSVLAAPVSLLLLARWSHAVRRRVGHVSDQYLRAVPTGSPRRGLLA